MDNEIQFCDKCFNLLFIHLDEEDKLIYSCGPKISNNKKCGPIYTIELPKYIQFKELQELYNKKPYYCKKWGIMSELII